MSLRAQSCLPRRCSIRVFLLSSCLASTPLGAGAFAQPNQSVEELPPLEIVTERPRPATRPTARRPLAKPSTASKSSAAPIVPIVGDTAGGATLPDGNGSGQREGTRPSLDLDLPDSTGSRLGLTPLETPASVEIIPGETIRERGQATVNEAVTQDATGFTSTASPGNGGTAMAVRGFAGHGAVMQLYDGTRLYVGAGTVTFPFDTWSAERLEVLRGPASVLYGEGAVGGVINFVPKRPSDYFRHEAEVAGGTDGTGRFGVGSGGPVNNNVAYRFDASGIRSNGWLEQESAFDSLVLSGALSLRPTRDLKLTISHDYGDQSPLRYFGTPLINGAIPDGLRDKNFNVRNSEVNFIDNWSMFKTAWTPNEWFELRNIAYRLTTNRHWRNVESYRFLDSGPDAGLVERTDYIAIRHDQEQLGNRFDAAFRTGLNGETRNELLVGFDVNSIDWDRRSNAPFSGVSFVDPFNIEPGQFLHMAPTVPRDRSDTFQHSFFMEDRLEISEKLSLIGGLRYEEVALAREDRLTGLESNKDFSEFTWRAGAVYTPIQNLAFYGQYATAVDPIGGALISMSPANFDFDLSTSRQIEVGAKRVFWAGRGEWTLALYDIERSNLLSSDPDSPQIVRQIGQQSSQGVEFTVGMQLSKELRYDGNVALLNAEFDEFIVDGVDFAGNRPPNVPEQVINNWVTWSLLPRWEAYVGVQWIGTIYNDDANTLKRPPSTLVNLGVGYDVTEKSELVLRVFNVFDEKYATDGGSFQWQLAPPRTAELVYRIKY